MGVSQHAREVIVSIMVDALVFGETDTQVLARTHCVDPTDIDGLLSHAHKVLCKASHFYSSQSQVAVNHPLVRART